MWVAVPVPMLRRSLLLAIPTAFLVIGCGPPYWLQSRAAGQLDCPASDVDVSTVHWPSRSGPGRYVAKGCGRETSYLCFENGECVDE